MKKALKMALEALTYIYTETTADEDELIDQAITAIKEALAQTGQEPVGKFAKFTDNIWREVTDGSAGMPLYTTPPQRNPLTDEEVEKIIKSNMSLQMNLAGIRADFEAAHNIKEKNT